MPLLSFSRLPLYRFEEQMELPRWAEEVAASEEYGATPLRQAVAEIDDRSQLRELANRLQCLRSHFLDAVDRFEKSRQREFPITWRSAIFNLKTVRGLGYIAVVAGASISKNRVEVNSLSLTWILMMGKAYLASKGSFLIVEHSSLFQKLSLLSHTCKQRIFIKRHFDHFLKEIENRDHSVLII